MSLSRRGYQVSQAVWSISLSKGYSIPLITPVIPASFGDEVLPGFTKVKLDEQVILEKTNLVKLYVYIYYIWDLYILYAGGYLKVSLIAEPESPWKPTFSGIAGSPKSLNLLSIY